jgi:hypothetical protein
LHCPIAEWIISELTLDCGGAKIFFKFINIGVNIVAKVVNIGEGILFGGL